MKPIILALLTALTIHGQANAAEQPEHPIVGTWTFTLQDTGCNETYRFRPDGKLLINSSEEATESEYEISVEPDTNGFYTLVDTVTQSNAKKDCSGHTTPTVTREPTSCFLTLPENPFSYAKAIPVIRASALSSDRKCHKEPYRTHHGNPPQTPA